jgi:hypothetical protein
VAYKSAPPLRLLLVVQDPEARRAYQAALHEIDVPDVGLDTVSSLSALHSALLERPYAGLLLDVGILARSSREEKALVGDILELFPVVRLDHDPQTHQVRSLYFGQQGGDPVPLATFIHEHCRGFRARRIRRHMRRSLHLNVLLHAGEGTAEEPERTNTLDVSTGGCFLYSIADWSGHSRVRLVIQELPDERLQAVVRWQVPWGIPHRLPGLGVEFSDLSPRHEQDLASLLFPRR